MSLRYCQISMTELFCEKIHWLEVINYFHKNFYTNVRPNNSYCSCSRADPKLELSAYRKRSIAICICCNILQAIEATNVRLATTVYSIWLLISMFCFDHLFSWDTFYCLVGIRNTFLGYWEGSSLTHPIYISRCVSKNWIQLKRIKEFPKWRFSDILSKI